MSDGAFTVVERVISQGAQFAIFIVAARVLGPAEFGLFALVSACAVLLFRFAEFGWAPFIMAWSGDSRVPRQVLFIAIVFGMLVSTTGIFGARASGGFGVAPETVTLMEFFAVWVMLATASSAQKGVMIWQRRMKASAICEITGECVGLAVAVSSLLKGQGVLSLAYGRLAFQSTHLVLSFVVTRMTPAPGLRGKVLRDLWVFSSQIFLSRMFVYVRLYFATFIVGGFLGVTAVGYYRAAERIVNAVAEVIVVPGQLLAWTLLRLARDSGDPEGEGARLSAALSRFLTGLFAIAAPIFIWLIFMSDELVHGLLSPRWQEAAPLIAIIAVARLLFVFGLANEPAMSVSGNARVLPFFTGAVFAVSISFTFVAVHIGLYALAWAQVVIAVLVLGATFWLYDRYVGVSPWQALRDLRGVVPAILLGTAALLLCDRLVAPMELQPLVVAIVCGLAALATYAAALPYFDRDLWSRFRSHFRKRISR